MKILYALMFSFMILKLSCFLISVLDRQCCFKRRFTKEANIMASFVERLKKIHENIKAYFF